MAYALEIDFVPMSPDAPCLWVRVQETVVLKLNGGLGTSMGLDKAKSLLTVKGKDTFLDLTAKQVSHWPSGWMGSQGLITDSSDGLLERAMTGFRYLWEI